MKQPFSQRLATLAAINGQFFLASVLGVSAWLLWPETAHAWALGLFSILFALASALCLKKAIVAMVYAFEHDRAIAAFEALGAQPKSSQMATNDQLKQAGMLDV